MTRTYTRITGKIPINQKVDPNYITQTRTYKLITPLFGGGAETQKPDAVTTVRASEVRGHLRFWWRATRGGNLEFDGDIAKMKKREEEIWGSAAQKGKAGPSKVKMRVLITNRTKSVLTKDVYDKKLKKNVPVEIGEPKSPWSYVSFPLREQKDEYGNITKSAGSVLDAGIEFAIEISYPGKWKDDVEASLWAWEVFGGIGARTRRGFGALQCGNSNKPTMQSARGEIQNGLNKHVSDENFPNGVPHLTKQLEFRTISKDDEILAWEYLFKKMKDFRQHRLPPKDNKPGRSNWPEPDSIRLILKENKKFTFGVHEPKHLVVKRFPRAKFGLPINFEFPKQADRDPKKTILQGKPLGNDKYIDRLASPLIIRPISCSDGAIGLAAKLEWKAIESEEDYTPPGGLFLTGKGYGDFPVKSNLIKDNTKDEAKDILPLNGEPDVLQAFLDYLK